MGDESADTIDLELNLKLGTHPLQARITLPAGVTRPRVMLPVFRGLSDTVVELGEKDTADKGLTISCANGCAACCRQMIPVSQAEAYQLAELIASFDPDRRDLILQRMAAAQPQLEAAGMLDWLRHPQRFEEQHLGLLGLEYFKLGIACPFLENESCSIYEDRPMVCREYLVTSPPERCADVETRAVERIPIWGSVSSAVTCLSLPHGEKIAHWVPLVLLLDWVEKNPEPLPTQTGQEIFTEVMNRLWGKAKESSRVATGTQ